MAKRLNAAKFQELVDASRSEVTKHAGDVMAELYQGMLKLPAITLPDGTTARVEAYYPPQVDEEGQHHCGIDVRLSSGDLLEFTVRNTGWERSFVKQHRQTPSARPNSGPAFRRR
jgi:hypothetical protein